MPSTTLSVTAFDAADAEAVEGAHRVQTIATAHDLPDFPPPCRRRFEVMLREPWPGVTTTHWVARTADGEIVGHLDVELPTLDNLENAFVGVTVLPAYRRRGVGRALYEQAVAYARENGRRRLMAFAIGSVPGLAPRDPAPTAFATSVGMTSALVEVRRRLDATTIDWPALDAAVAAARDRAAAAGYSLVRWRDAVPEEYVDGVAMLDSDFINEAPMGDLALEAEKVDAARIREAERIRALAGRVGISTAAVHDATGTLVAWSEVGRAASHVEHVGQGITLVHPAHRGHRLGLLTKVENLRYALAELPGARYVDTWNAAVNEHMIAINEQMGFRPIDGWHNWQAEI